MSDGHEMTTILIGFCSATLIVLNKCNTCQGVGRKRAANTNLMVFRFVEFGDILSTAAPDLSLTVSFSLSVHTEKRRNVSSANSTTPGCKELNFTSSVLCKLD